jgi:hypothetical protein
MKSSPSSSSSSSAADRGCVLLSCPDSWDRFALAHAAFAGRRASCLAAWAIWIFNRATIFLFNVFLPLCALPSGRVFATSLMCHKPST